MTSYVTSTIDIEQNNKLIMTLKEWQESSYLSIENIIYNSSSDRTDKRGDDAMVDEPIGISHRCSPKMLYDIISKKKNNKSLIVSSSFSPTMDEKRRKKDCFSRKKVIENITKNNIRNTKVALDNFYERLLRSKFVISPEGNGVDTHRHWESLYCGAIPIIERNTNMENKLKDLPVLYTTDYSEINDTYLNNVYEKMLHTKYNFGRLIMNNYPRESQESMIRRSTMWSDCRNVPFFWPVNFDNIFPGFYDKVKLITITNTPYLKITKNCIKSIDRINIKCPVKIFTIDETCYNTLKSENYEEVQSLGDICKETSRYCDKNWSRVTIQKIVSIREQLDLSDIVIYIDGDIVVEDSRFITYCYEKLTKNKDLDMLAQCEWKGKNMTDEICSGFLAIKSNARTKKMFDIDTSINYPNDQNFVNKKRNMINYEMLPIELYPNGKYYYEERNKTKISPYLIHFNFVMFSNKISKIKTLKKWYN